MEGLFLIPLIFIIWAGIFVAAFGDEKKHQRYDQLEANVEHLPSGPAIEPVMELIEEAKYPVKELSGVVLKRVELPFFHTVGNLVKLAIAAVPAIIIVTIFWWALFFVLWFTTGFGQMLGRILLR